MESIGNGLLARAPEAIVAGETKQTPVTVETGAAKAIFAVTIADENDEIELRLRTPSGATIVAADAVNNPNIIFRTANNLRSFEIVGPEAGEWIVEVVAGAIVDGTIEVLAFADNDGVQINVSVDDDTVDYPDPMIVRATPQYKGENVVGATVTGTVIRPGGTTRSIELFDDGLASHGDFIPGDGIYSAIFDAYESFGNGTYTFEITVDGAGGMTYGGEELLFPNGAVQCRGRARFHTQRLGHRRRHERSRARRATGRADGGRTCCPPAIPAYTTTTISPATARPPFAQTPNPA